MSVGKNCIKKNTRVRRKINFKVQHDSVSLSCRSKQFLGRNENNKSKLERVNIKSFAFFHVIKLRKIRFFSCIYLLCVFSLSGANLEHCRTSANNAKKCVTFLLIFYTINSECKAENKKIFLIIKFATLLLWRIRIVL